MKLLELAVLVVLLLRVLRGFSNIGAIRTAPIAYGRRFYKSSL
jgi:hypothetical protein